MLKAFRIRLVSITMLAVSIALFAITGAINFTNSAKQKQRADSMLMLISQYNGTIPQNSFEIEDKVDFSVSRETPFQTRYFVIRTDYDGNLTDAMTNYIASVNFDDIKRYAKYSASLKDGSKGSMGQYRYLVTDSGHGKMIAFLDRSQDIEASLQLLGISIFTAVISLVFIFLIMLVLSKRIVMPFVKNQEKQKQFITDAGHELKTPLAIIQTNAEVLEMCYGKNEWLDSIQNQTRRLDGLVKGLLQLSRSGELLKQNEHIVFPLSAAVKEIAESFITLADKNNRKLRFSITPDIEYKGDAQALKTLVSILIDNAIKYSTDGGEIRVTLERLGKSTARTAKLIISNDTDISDNEDPNRFFERFYRSDSSRSRETGGYGIGLSVAKTIIEAHKGKITVSKSNGKIHFTVIL